MTRAVPPAELTAALADQPAATPETQQAMSKNTPENDPIDATAGGMEDEEPKRGRLSRLRFTKKKDMPGGLWLKCESCGKTVFRKELESLASERGAKFVELDVDGREKK